MASNYFNAPNGIVRMPSKNRYGLIALNFFLIFGQQMDYVQLLLHRCLAPTDLDNRHAPLLTGVIGGRLSKSVLAPRIANSFTMLSRVPWCRIEYFKRVGCTSFTPLFVLHSRNPKAVVQIRLYRKNNRNSTKCSYF